MEQQFIGQATPEQIKEWKEKVRKDFGADHKVYDYKCEGRVCYLRSVTRDDHALAASKVSTSPSKFNETIIDRIFLGGDITLKKETGYYFGLSDFVDELMNKKKGELGEL